ncbi:MAG: hypothetical protein AB1634_06930 [Thermodesulfobacteriota bacterium]
MPVSQRRVLIVTFSFSGQTRALVQALAAGLAEAGVQVVVERLQPLAPLRFPLAGIAPTLVMMLATFFRQRLAIAPLSSPAAGDFQLVVVAGPTWSYSPSGPVLSFLDRDAPALVHDRPVLPVISCRGYWRTHLAYLRRRLAACGGRVVNFLVLTHPCAEPWRTLGVFLKIAGRRPERHPLLSRFYPRYGHSRSQIEEVRGLGRCVGEALVHGEDLAALRLGVRPHPPAGNAQ